MPTFIYRAGLTLGLAALLGLGQARAQEVYQAIGSFRDGSLPISATEPLYVVLPAPLPEPSRSKKYKKPDERAAYLAEITAQRSALELAVKQWQLSPVTVIPGWSKFHAAHREDIGHLEGDDLNQLIKTATNS